jgi:hypothetical protein
VEKREKDIGSGRNERGNKDEKDKIGEGKGMRREREERVGRDERRK